MKPHHLAVLAMTILAAILTTAVLLDGPAAVTFDAKSYWQFGESVAAGDWLLKSHPIAYRTPAYPWFVALCQWIAGSHALMLVVVLQGALSVALVPLNAWLAARLAEPGHSHWAAIATAALTAIGISRLYFARALLSETLFLFAMMLHLACIVGLATGRARMGWALAAGFSLGLTILVRPVAQWLWIAHLVLLVPMLWQTAATAAPQFDWRLLKALVCGAIVAGLVVSPWCLRNASLFGEPFITEFVGRNVWIVTFQDQAGAGLALPSTSEAERLRSTVTRFKPAADFKNTWDVSEGLTRSGMPDDDADRLMKTVAVQAAQSNLGLYLERFGRRLINFFRCVSDEPPTFEGVQDVPPGQRWWRVPTRLEATVHAMRASPHLGANMLLTAAVAAAWLSLLATRRYRRIAIWLAAMIGYFAAVTAAIEIPAYRYRLVVEPLMGIIVGLAIAARVRKPDS